MESIVKSSVEKHGRGREALVSILRDIVKEKKFLSEEAMQLVAAELGLSAAQVYGTASFYSFLYTEPVGENVIKVCKTIICDNAGKQQIVRAIEKKLGIGMYETTSDGKFTLTEANCLGQCDNGPAMLINDDIYTGLTPESAVQAIDKYLHRAQG